MFDTIRMNNVEYTENALEVLDGWMRMAERWNKRRFAGSGGFTMERIADNNLLPPLPERCEAEGRLVVRTSKDNPDTEDRDDVMGKLLL